MGFIVAANPFAQMLFSPLVGWWTNKLGSIRGPLIVSLLLFSFASAVYSCLEIFDHYVKHWMFWCRFLVGVSSANIAACRSYLSAATKHSERTKAVSMISLAQVLGFVVGPAVQSAVVPLGDEGVWIIPQKLRLNMYTATGWINVLLAVLNIYFFMPHVFKEHMISMKEAKQKQNLDEDKNSWKGPKPDYFAAWTLIVAFFVMVFNFMLLETLGTPLTMDQLGWSKKQSLWYMGMVMSIGALCSIITFASVAPLSKRFSEVKLMIWIGFLTVLVSNLACIPYSGDPPKRYDVDFKLNLTIFCDQHLKNTSLDKVLDREALNQVLRGYNRSLELNSTIPTNETAIRQMTLDCGEDLLGCPSTQEWCSWVPAMTYFQFIFGYVLTVLGYPIGVTLIQTLFSKVLGSRPQGVWMGLLVGSGCFSRVMGPVFVTYIYEEFGTLWTFSLSSSMMAVMLVWLLNFRKRLEPRQLGKEEEQGKELKVLVKNEPEINEPLEKNNS
ncbi:major facilitator superfamily domain-containing protein 8 isoform X2 [Sitophilus oryzae]|nr:major facilitator superfamily domain-containing protein 8 isoform X2 [Sitophilus oryzae]